MKKLSKKQIAFLSNHLEAMDKAYKTQIYFCFNDKASGEEAFDFLQDVYSDECNYSAWNGWFGIGDKRDFYLGFVSKQARDNVYNDIKNAKDGYQSTNQYQNENFGSSYDVDSETETVQTKAKSWTTYIVIGAAAIVILLLLWDRKKK